MAGFLSLRSVIRYYSDAMFDRENQPIFQRRAYNWRNLEKVLPTGPGLTRGTGNARRYNETTVPLIAVMLQISDRLSSVEQLDEISRTIQQGLAGKRTPFARCWAAALVKAAAESMDRGEIEDFRRRIQQAGFATGILEEKHYLTIAFPSLVHGLAVRCGSEPKFDYGEDIDVYVLDLDYIFYTLSYLPFFVTITLENLKP